MEIVNQAISGQWQFWIDRGGTFTDLVARDPNGVMQVRKLLSENPEHYRDASLQGICDFLKVDKDDLMTVGIIDAVKMGTTVATNALLERKGERAVMITTQGFKDIFRIGYQSRPDIFALEIILPSMLYEDVIEVEERTSTDGKILISLNIERAHQSLQASYDKGIRSCAIVLLHGYRFSKHEQQLSDIARQIGFTQISSSHKVSPLIKLVDRGDTTIVDAYLTPVLKRYVDCLSGTLGNARVLFMKSDGGLTDAQQFTGKDAILSGPAGGIVAGVKTAELAGFDKVIGFDMGGTSTDVCHYAGEFDRSFDNTIAGVRIRAPMLRMHTVAAGGGSVLEFDGDRFRVGPESAGADPGPACYRRGGPLTITDCNTVLGKLQPEFFPAIFGPNIDLPLDKEIVTEKFIALAEEIFTATGKRLSSQEVADGFIKIAVNNMAQAIKKISVQRGYDVTQYVMNCFGGAGGQHACLVADALGIKTILLHPFAGVLSAYGMGLANITAVREKTIEMKLTESIHNLLNAEINRLVTDCLDELRQQGLKHSEQIVETRLYMKYQGTDTSISVIYADSLQVRKEFERLYKQQYGFIMPEKALIIETLIVEVISKTNNTPVVTTIMTGNNESETISYVSCFMAGEEYNTAVYDREKLSPTQTINGPAIIRDPISTICVEPSWKATIDEKKNILLRRIESLVKHIDVKTQVDPIMLEVFNNLFMSIAEQMGSTLQNTAYSTNIKERLDFSCAIFDNNGNIIANAPHVPVHLGSMSESVRMIMRERYDTIQQGDVFALNDPYHGGTHLPDITVITPIFDLQGKNILFYVANRAHHADIGGITPGSMPPHSQTIHEERILIRNFQLVDKNGFREKQIREILTSGSYPARNVDQNIADLKAQIAANKKGVLELVRMQEHYGQKVICAYMGYMQDYAEVQTRKAIDKLTNGNFIVKSDDDSEIHVSLKIDHDVREATIDFTGTSAQQISNFNAPAAVTRAVVLYVFRTLLDADIPLNEGCFKPLRLIIPESSMLNPVYPAAIVAGNVEVSQCITDALYGALGILAGAQGTMNNLTFGNARYQHYETLCGGAGAGHGFHGASAVHTHMTNSRLTDVEILESRFPVMLDKFEIRENSGGKGQWHGGNGIRRMIHFLEPMTVALLANRHVVPPFGLAGGDSGQCGKAWVKKANGEIYSIESRDKVILDAGDHIIIETPGGGGFGKSA